MYMYMYMYMCVYMHNYALVHVCTFVSASKAILTCTCMLILHTQALETCTCTNKRLTARRMLNFNLWSTDFDVQQDFQSQHWF